MSTAIAIGAASVQATALRKITLRLSSFLFALYLICFIDRTNAGIAALSMNQDLALGATEFGLGAGLYFVGYWLFEVPSNLVLYRVGARVWLARIAISWGIVGMCLGLTQGAHSFYALRFLLGVAEAGLYPGVVFYIGLWYPAAYRAKPLAIFMSASVVAGIVMGPLSTWIMDATNGMYGVAGWRWMFVLEGLPAVILGIMTFFCLTDHPKDAVWLTAEEKGWLLNALDADRRAQPPVEHRSVGRFLKDKRMWIMAGYYASWTAGNVGIMFWLPTILKASSSAANQSIGFLYGFFFVCAFFGMFSGAWFWRLTGDRRTTLLLCGVVPFVTMTVSAFTASPVLAYVMLCVAAFFIWGMMPVFWTLPAEYWGGATAAAAIAFINSWTGLGGLIGPSLVGFIKDATGKFEWAVFALAVAFLFQAGFTLALRIKRKVPARA